METFEWQNFEATDSRGVLLVKNGWEERRDPRLLLSATISRGSIAQDSFADYDHSRGNCAIPFGMPAIPGTRSRQVRPLRFSFLLRRGSIRSLRSRSNPSRESGAAFTFAGQRDFVEFLAALPNVTVGKSRKSNKRK